MYINQAKGVRKREAKEGGVQALLRGAKRSSHPCEKFLNTPLGRMFRSNAPTDLVEKRSKDLLSRKKSFLGNLATFYL